VHLVTTMVTAVGVSLDPGHLARRQQTAASPTPDTSHRLDAGDVDVRLGVPGETGVGVPRDVRERRPTGARDR
jgi:hypothetical protein